MIWSKLFWKDTVERVVSTVAQAATGVLTAGGLGLFDVDFKSVLSVSLLAGLVAFAKSLAATYIGDPGSASLVPSLAAYPTENVTEVFEEGDEEPAVLIVDLEQDDEDTESTGGL